MTCYNWVMLDVQRKLIEQADQALVIALMELIEAGAANLVGKNSESHMEAVWRSICHARDQISSLKKD